MPFLFRLMDLLEVSYFDVKFLSVSPTFEFFILFLEFMETPYFILLTFHFLQ